MATTLRLDSSSLVHQSVQKKGAYARDDKKFVDRWDTDERMCPPLGSHTAGERAIEKKAAVGGGHPAVPLCALQEELRNRLTVLLGRQRDQFCFLI